MRGSSRPATPTYLNTRSSISRLSIIFETSFVKTMDCRVKPGNDESLLRLQAGLVDHAFGNDAIGDEEAGELLGRVQDRLERAIGELLFAEDRIVGDADHVIVDLVDDRLRRAGGRHQAQKNPRENGRDTRPRQT